MNNQMPYNFMPPFNTYPNNELQMIMDRIDNIEKNIKRIEKKLVYLENNYQMPYPNFNPNNYIK